MSEEEIIGDVQYGALRNPLLNRVLKRFGAVAFKRCSVMMEFEHFLQSCLGGRRGGVCLEVGTFNGISAVVLSQYFDRVICTSIDDSPEALIKHDVLSFLGINNVRFFDCRDNDEKRGIVQQLDEYDFCYLDGNHREDTQTDWELVRDCGKVLFHEYWPIQPSVWNLVNSLPQHEVLRAQFDCMAYWERGVSPRDTEPR